jgi:hypothetical protein
MKDLQVVTAEVSAAAVEAGAVEAAAVEAGKTVTVTVEAKVEASSSPMKRSVSFGCFFC